MQEARKVIPVIFLFLVFGYIASLAYTFLQDIPVQLIEPFLLSWRMHSVLLLFVNYLPAWQTAGILTGYAVVFSTRKEPVRRWSEVHIAWLKGAFTLCIVLSAVFVILSEGVVPLSLRTRETLVSRTADYTNNMELAARHITAREYAEAEIRIQFALAVWPDSSEALSLLERVRYSLALEAESLYADGNKTGMEDVSRYVLNPEGLSVISAIDLSREASSQMDWYAQHYYAMLAWRLASDTDPNKEYALRLAADGWNHIVEGSALLSAKDDAELYRTKRDGYEALDAGDYLRAYYIFNDLSQAEKESGLRDPDVGRFLTLSRQGLLQQSFFIDETLSVRAFESARDIVFTIKTPGGLTDVVSMRGLTYAKNNNTDVWYIRDFEMARFDPVYSLVFRLAVPYAKMFPYRLSDEEAQPRILLRSVDRDRREIEVIPQILEGAMSEADSYSVLLEMPYRELNAVIAANRGFDTMTLAELTGFADRADRYGFSSRAVITHMLARFSDPFLVLVISILALTLGWKYRMEPYSFFKAWWVLVLPLIPFVLMMTIGVVRYIARLVITVFVYRSPAMAMVFTLGTLSLSFIFSCLYFWGQRSE